MIPPADAHAIIGETIARGDAADPHEMAAEIVGRLAAVGLAIVPVQAPRNAEIAAIAAHAGNEGPFIRPETKDGGFVRGLKRGLEMAVNTEAARVIWAAMVESCRVRPRGATVASPRPRDGSAPEDWGI